MRIIGHRGARAEQPENTLAGFRTAIEAGVDGVELDLRLSSDGELMVIHDESTLRTTGTDLKVANSPSALLSTLSVGGTSSSALGVPTLAQVLDTCPELRDIQLEVKPVTADQLPAITAAVVTLFRDRPLYDRAWVTSFDRDILREVGRADARIRLGYLFETPEQDPVAAAQALGASLLAPNREQVEPALVCRARDAGMTVSVWTVNDIQEAEHLQSLGVDSVITDYPTTFCRHFGA